MVAIKPLTLCALLSLASLAGCASPSPLARPGEWRPVGANDTNLAAMVANPLDLVNGAVPPPADGAVLANGVARYRADRGKTLMDSGVSKITATGSAAAPQSAASSE